MKRPQNSPREESSPEFPICLKKRSQLGMCQTDRLDFRVQKNFRGRFVGGVGFNMSLEEEKTMLAASM